MNPFDIKSVLLAKHAQHIVLIHFPIALFLVGLQRHAMPMQMFVSLREHVDPTIAVATPMMSLSRILYQSQQCAVAEVQ